MSPKFYSLQVKNIRQETADCVSIAFDVPDELQSNYQFVQGQYLTLKANIEGEEVRRSYSICVAPSEKEWRVAVKRVQGGLFSTYANEVLKEGDWLEVMTPMGNFYSDVKSNQAKKYLAFAGGSGITPIVSIMKTVLATESDSEFVLIYGNQHKNGIIFKEEIEGLKNRYMNRLSVYHVLSKEFTDAPIFTGLIDQEKCQAFYDKLVDLNAIDEVFICGPEPMMDAIENSLKTVKPAKAKVHIERFTPSSSTSQVKKVVSEADADKKSTISIKLDGITFEVQASYSESILDAALRSGADLPFACKGGVCCTCRAKLLEGNAEMSVNYALVEEEVERGFILTCQAHPKTEKIAIDFDVR